VVVHQREHETFARDGDNVVLELPITFPQAALGGDVEVPTLGGAARLRIPAGTQTHTLLRLRGKGLPRFRGNGHGDQVVRVVVVTPERLSDEERRLLERLKEVQRDGAGRRGVFDRFRVP